VLEMGMKGVAYLADEPDICFTAYFHVIVLQIATLVGKLREVGLEYLLMFVSAM
jgi:hypothetical protein